MRLPRWTVYPALAVIGGLLFVAVPHRTSEPFAGAAASARAGAGTVVETSRERVVVLGIDGLDPDLLLETIERFPDRTKNFQALIADGDGVQSLKTSCPPQSPVAWSNFITGMDPGGHGVFDFLHRDLVTRMPIPSTTVVGGASHVPLWGDWQFPIGGDTESNRTGESFWEVLADAGVPADIWRMPINFPVEPAKGLSFPGMMTPAIDSAYGECTLYTTDVLAAADSDYDKLITLDERVEGRLDTYLIGAANPFKTGDPHERVPVTIYLDREAGSAAVEIEGHVLVLKPGQWTAFVGARWDLLPSVLSYLPGGSMDGVVRFYLRSIEPEFEMYVSPVNFDPENPAVPVSEPEDASAELADAIGVYYTQGMAEDVNALKRELITVPEFMAQTGLVYDERVRMLDYALDRYLNSEDGGLLFFYFSTVDLCCHMMWRHFDTTHPHHDPALAAQSSESWSGRPGSTWKDTIYDLYLKMDQVLGHLRERIGPDTTIVVMSDHGFAPYRRKFSLNTWLLENGYLVLNEGYAKELPKDDPDFSEVSLALGAKRGPDGRPLLDENGKAIFGAPVDWSRTRAYGVGFNGLYLNLAGREKDDPGTKDVDESGIVQPGAEAEALLAELKAKLERVTDPEVPGARPILSCDLATEVYHGPRVSEAPDILVGYNTAYGNSDPASLARIPNAILEDNTGGTFNGSHLMAPEVVSGTLLTNRPVRSGEHGLTDLTVEILERYGVEPPKGMQGHRVLD